MKSKHAITRFINKYGKNRWLKRLHKRMDEAEVSTGKMPEFKTEYDPVKELVAQAEPQSLRLNKIEELLIEVKESVERLEAKP